MRARKMVAKGFTLVEILIVVVILGILAAIVIPQFTNASESAKASSSVSQLQALRSQIELYRNQHNGLYPTTDGAVDSAWAWTKMTSRTDIDGAVGTTDGTHIYGPYVQQPSKNPFLSSTTNTVVDDDGTDGTSGWELSATGVLRVAVPTDVATDQNMDTTNDVVAD